MLANPLQALLEVLQRRVGDVVRQTGRLEIGECQRRIAARRVERRARLVEAAARAVEDHHCRVRSVACGQVERADQPVLAHLAARDTLCRQALGQCGLCLWQMAFLAACGEGGDERIRHRVVEEFAALGVHRSLRPDEAHGVGAVVAAASQRRGPGQIDLAVGASAKARMALPCHAAALRLGCDLDHFARLRAAHDDAAWLVDQRVGGSDRDVQCGHYLATLVTIMAAVRSLVMGVTLRPFFVAQMFL